MDFFLPVTRKCQFVMYILNTWPLLPRLECLFKKNKAACWEFSMGIIPVWSVAVWVAVRLSIGRCPCQGVSSCTEKETH